MPTSTLTRRRLLQHSLCLPLALSPLQNLAWAGSTTQADRALRARLAALEQRSGGQLGVHILHTGTGQGWGWRSGERFPMCSTFKLWLAAMALDAQARGQLDLDETLAFSTADLVAHSPITGARVAEGRLRVAELCAATLATSDNAAANLVLRRLGGPPALTQFMRGLGDNHTRLDRYEPQLNGPGTQADWDSSTPAASAASLQRLLLGEALPAPQRQQLITWLQASQTGGHRLKAGLPAGWAVAEKTGTSDRSSNDIGVVWPAQGEALVVVAYIRNSRAGLSQRNACLAGVGALLAQAPVTVG